MLYDNLDELKESLKGCGLCPKMWKSRIEVLGKENDIPVMWKGVPNAKFFFLGQCPGRLLEKVQDKSNIDIHAFAYGSGNILKNILTDAGYSDDEVFITNVVKCNTPADNIFINKDVERCIKLWLENEIKLVKPSAIIIMGKVAQTWFEQFFDKNILFNIKVFKVYHPSYLGYRPEAYDGYLKSLTAIRESVLKDTTKQITLFEVKG